MYESDWWRGDTMQLKKALLFVIQRSQMSKNFRAGGMIDLDLQSFTKVSYDVYKLNQIDNSMIFRFCKCRFRFSL